MYANNQKIGALCKLQCIHLLFRPIKAVTKPLKQHSVTNSLTNSNECNKYKHL